MREEVEKEVTVTCLPTRGREMPQISSTVDQSLRLGLTGESSFCGL